MDAVNRAKDPIEDSSRVEEVDRVWVCLSRAFGNILLGPSTKPPGKKDVLRASSQLSESDNHGSTDQQKSNADELIPEIPFLPGARKRRDRRKLSSEGPHKGTVEKDDMRSVSRSTDEIQAKEDGDLELRILDCLTDEILTACGTASQSAIDSLIQVVEEGISRPSKYQIPQSTKHSNFSLVCIRKMYVLCSRGYENTVQGSKQLTNEDLYEQVAQVRNHVAKCALPRFLKICHNMISNFAEESQYTPLGDAHVERLKLEQIICILEVLATMTLSPGVVDSMVPQDDPMGDYIKLMRKRPDVICRGKERTHLLFLYDSLCSLITCRDSRIRDMVRDVLGLAGAELGISLNALLLSP